MYEWDERKQAANRAKHGVDVTDVVRFGWETAATWDDFGHDEPRFVSTAFIGDRPYLLVWTPCGPMIRVITLRRATPSEMRRYAEEP